MRAVISVEFVLVMFIVLALAILIFSLPIVLGSIGLQEWGNLIKKVQNIQKYDGDSVTLTLPHYIDRIEFIKGYDNKCGETSSAACYICKNLEGNTFITISIDQKEKPSIGSVLWKLVTFRPNKAKSDAVKMSLTDICYPKDFESSFHITVRGSPDLKIDYYGWALVLEGDRNKIKEYCVKPKIIKTRNEMQIHVEEGKCK